MSITLETRRELPPCSHTPAPWDGPTREEVLAERRAYCTPALLTYYRDPVMIVEGHMQYLWDETGRRYLDCFAGIVTVSAGHCHPRVTAAAVEQARRLQHTTTIYLHPNITRFARKLAEKMPPGLDVTYFVNSGSDANDLAIMMARLYTGNSDVIALRNSYHGGSPTTMGLTSHHTWKFPAQQSMGIHHAINPDPYRSPFSGTPEEIAAKSARDIEEIVRFSTPGRIAAYIAEPIQGVGGATMGHPSYLAQAYEVARKYGGLCIADEVQTGFGRTGANYWGFQNSGVTPDIVTMAKGIGNGIPLAAVTTRREIAEKLKERIHFNTFGGNPVSMAQGIAVLEAIDEDGLQENSRAVGEFILASLRKMKEHHPLIGDVRGMGLMIGVELVRDHATKEPANTETAELLEHAREMGVLLGKGGLFGNVIRLKPPLCITREDAEYLVHVLDESLRAIEAK